MVPLPSVPPRYAFWTILIDGKATAFRAKEREELLPTFAQLARTNTDIALRYFARGKLWDNPEQATWAAKHPAPMREPRGKEWRPGGTHKDPRARVDAKRKTPKPEPQDRHRREKPEWQAREPRNRDPRSQDTRGPGGPPARTPPVGRAPREEEKKWRKPPPQEGTWRKTPREDGPWRTDREGKRPTENRRSTGNGRPAESKRSTENQRPVENRRPTEHKRPMDKWQNRQAPREGGRKPTGSAGGRTRYSRPPMPKKPR